MQSDGDCDIYFIIFTALFLFPFLLAASNPFYFVYSSSLSSRWTLNFCSILKLAGVDVGNLSKKGKIWKVLILEVFLLVGYLTELCLYIYR